MYAITFSNGKTLTGLKVNGSAFETREDVKAEDLAGSLRHVVIRQTSADEGEPEYLAGEYDNMSLGYLKRHGDITQIVLLPRDEAEAEKLQLRGDIDYIAMMAGIEL